MILKRKIRIFFLVLCLSLLPFEASASSEEFQTSRKSLSDSFYGLLDGFRSLGKGFWGVTSNGGKVLWHGTREGMTKTARQAQKADRWLQKHLW